MTDTNDSSSSCEPKQTSLDPVSALLDLSPTHPKPLTSSSEIVPASSYPVFTSDPVPLPPDPLSISLNPVSIESDQTAPIPSAMTTPQQMNEVLHLKNLFDAFDDQSDGKVTVEEVVHTLEIIGESVPDTDVDDIRSKFGSTIDFPNFLTIISKRLEPTDDGKRLLEAFKAFDENRDGKFDVNELVGMVDYIQDFNLEEFEDMVRDMEPDDDGCINYKKFINKLQKPST